MRTTYPCLVWLLSPGTGPLLFPPPAQATCLASDQSQYKTLSHRGPCKALACCLASFIARLPLA